MNATKLALNAAIPSPSHMLSPITGIYVTPTVKTVQNRRA